MSLPPPCVASTLLHINGNFIASSVHKNLVLALQQSNSNLEQIVFVPLRSSSLTGQNAIIHEKIDIIYKKCQGSLIRYFPFLKVIITFISLILSLNKTKFSSTAHVLAHTLWSDGCVAYLLHLKTGCAYTVCIRSTDINWFIPRMPHYRWLMRRIIANANSVIFISAAHQKKLEMRHKRLFRSARVTFVVPNGIDDFWFNNHIGESSHRANIVLFVGRFDDNKNLKGVFDAVSLLRQRSNNIRLIAAGGSEEDFLALVNLTEIPDWLDIVGKIKDKNELLRIYRQSAVFAMPSFHETFGLTYIEALSQGCPYIHSAGEGIDFYFRDPTFSRAVKPTNKEEIAAAILSLMKAYPSGVEPELVSASIKDFNWLISAGKYLHAIKCS